METSYIDRPVLLALSYVLFRLPFYYSAIIMVGKELMCQLCLVCSICYTCATNIWNVCWLYLLLCWLLVFCQQRLKKISPTYVIQFSILKVTVKFLRQHVRNTIRTNRAVSINRINCLISFWVICVLLEIFWKTSLQMSLYVLIVLLIIVAKKYQHNKTLVYQ